MRLTWRDGAERRLTVGLSCVRRRLAAWDLYFAVIDRFANGDQANDRAFDDAPRDVNYQGGDWPG